MPETVYRDDPAVILPFNPLGPTVPSSDPRPNPQYEPAPESIVPVTSEPVCESVAFASLVPHSGQIVL